MTKPVNTKTALSRRLTTALRVLAENTLEMRNAAISSKMDWVGRYQLYAEGGIKTCVYHQAQYHNKWHEVDYGNCTTPIEDQIGSGTNLPAVMFDSRIRKQIFESWISFIVE